MGTTIGPKKNLIINGNEDYPIEKLKPLVVNGYVDENNNYYFDNSAITLANQFFSTDRKSYLKTPKPWSTSESIDTFPLSRMRNKPHVLNSSKVNSTDWKIGSTSEHEIRSISHVSVESPQYSQLTALQDNLHKESIKPKRNL